MSVPPELNGSDLVRLLDRTVDPQQISKDLVPPPHFGTCSFGTYIPDPAFLSQANAKQHLLKNAHRLTRRSSFFSELRSRVFRTRPTAQGIYLDGGFGVGKTHLLAAFYHETHGQKAYLSFQELMFLVGMIRLTGVVEMLGGLSLLAVDEFELDDPANTRIATNLFRQLLDRGVTIVTTSNTPPGALGEGKFSVVDFARELGELSRRFTTVTLNGNDYRMSHPSGGTEHWFLGSIPTGLVLPQPHLTIAFVELLQILSRVHPVRVRQNISSLRAITLLDVDIIQDQHDALRFVYLVDKLYDNEIEVVASSRVPIEQLFAASYFRGGDTKKFMRATSRLHELTSFEG